MVSKKVDYTVLFFMYIYMITSMSMWIFYNNHQKDKISYVLLDPVSAYVYISDLIIELQVG